MVKNRYKKFGQGPLPPFGHCPKEDIFFGGRCSLKYNVEIFSDLPGHMVNNSVIPHDILVSNGFGSKPDLVVISRSNKKIALFELTCPLERNIHTANTYKRVAIRS